MFESWTSIHESAADALREGIDDRSVENLHAALREIRDLLALRLTEEALEDVLFYGLGSYHRVTGQSYTEWLERLPPSSGEPWRPVVATRRCREWRRLYRFPESARWRGDVGMRGPEDATGQALDWRERFPALSDLIGNYLFQTWTDDHETPVDAIDDYIRHRNLPVLISAVEELQRLSALGLSEGNSTMCSTTNLETATK